MALTVPEADPERLAYAMWNEGRADEAIEFLEQHLAAERDRRRETALVPVSAEGKDAIRVEPASEWRERHRAALASGDFNAFGASVHTIDITPTQADAVVPHTVRGSLRTGWLMGVCLAVLGISAAGAYFVTRDGDVATTILAASEEVITNLKPETAAPAAAAPEVELATVEPDVDGADVPPPDETELASTLPLAVAVDEPPPEQDPAVDETTSVAPEENATADEVASTPPEEDATLDEVASTFARECAA